MNDDAITWDQVSRLIALGGVLWLMVGLARRIRKLEQAGEAQA